MQALQSAKLREYHARQNATIDAVLPFYREQRTDGKDDALGEVILPSSEGATADGGGRRRWDLVAVAINLSFFCNIFLLFIKVVAYASSPSSALLASLMDSALDIASGCVLWGTAKFMTWHDPYSFPQGKTRFEPIGIALFATVMGVASVQIMVESAQALGQGYEGPLPVTSATWGILAKAIALKAALYALCRFAAKARGSATLDAYAEDHFNDTLSNSVAVAAVALAVAAPEELWWADPAGAIAVALWIIVSWFLTGK